MFTYTSFLVFLFVVSFCMGVRVKFFKRYSCQHPDYQFTNLLDSLAETKTRGLLSCAGICSSDHRCEYAVFQYSTKSCQQIRSNGNLTSPASYTEGEGRCSILVKTKEQNISFQNESTDLQSQEVTPESLCQEFKDRSDARVEMIFVTSIPLYDQVHLTMCTGMCSSKFGCLTHTTLDFDVGLNVFFDPPFFDVKLFNTSETNALKRQISLLGDIKNATSWEYDNEKMLKIPQDSGSILVYERGGNNIGTLDDLVTAVSQGFKRASKYPIWMKIDREAGDVKFEMALLDLRKKPFYSTIQESALTEKRHIFRHKLIASQIVEHDEEKSQPYWKMDVNWRKLPLDKSSSSEDVFSALKQVVTSGQDLRVIIDGSISSDVTYIRIKDHEVSCQLANHLTPFQAEINDASEVSVLVSTVSSSKRLYECKGNDIYNITDNLSSVDWYTGTRNWEKVLSYNKKKRTSGSRTLLHQAAIEGKNLRLCYTVSDDVFNCFPIARLKRKSNGNTLCLSPIYLRDDAFQITDVASNDLTTSPCTLATNLVSTLGWVRTLLFEAGANTRDIKKDTRIQEWYAEM